MLSYIRMRAPVPATRRSRSAFPRSSIPQEAGPVPRPPAPGTRDYTRSPVGRQSRRGVLKRPLRSRSARSLRSRWRSAVASSRRIPSFVGGEMRRLEPPRQILGPGRAESKDCACFGRPARASNPTAPSAATPQQRSSASSDASSGPFSIDQPKWRQTGDERMGARRTAAGGRPRPRTARMRAAMRAASNSDNRLNLWRLPASGGSCAPNATRSSKVSRDPPPASTGDACRC